MAISIKTQAENRTKIRNLVVANMAERYQNLLIEVAESRLPMGINVANPQADLEKYNLDSGAIVLPKNYMYLFDGTNVLFDAIPESVRKYIEDNRLEDDFDFNLQKGTIDINKIKKYLSDNGLSDKLDSLKNLEYIKAKFDENGEIVANKQIFSCLNKNLKANTVAIFVLNKYYLPELDSGRDFSSITDEMTHVKDFVVAKILSMEETSTIYYNLKPTNFTNAKNIQELNQEVEAYFLASRQNVFVDDDENIKFLYRSEKGSEFYNFVELLSTEALDYEGSKMGHCVGSGSYDEGVSDGSLRIVSLRDKKNEPHATIEIDTKTNTIRQIQGKENKFIVDKYHQAVHDFVKFSGMSLDDKYYKKIPILQTKDGQEFAVNSLDVASLKKLILSDGIKFLGENTEDDLAVLQAVVNDENIKTATLKKYGSLFVKLLKNSKTKESLTSLNLYNNNIDVEGAKALALNTNITSLNLSGNYIGDEGAKALALNTNITSLNLYNNDIGDEGAKALALNMNITSLNLYNNNIGDEGAKAFVMALENGNQNLLELKGVNDSKISEYLAKNKENASNVLKDILSGKEVSAKDVVSRRNAIMFVANEQAQEKYVNEPSIQVEFIKKLNESLNKIAPPNENSKSNVKEKVIGKISETRKNIFTIKNQR